VTRKDLQGVETIWKRMYLLTFIQGRSRLVMNGMSSIDIALWTINARVAGVPLLSIPCCQQRPGKPSCLYMS